MACSVLSRLVCSGRGGHSDTLGLSGLTDHINTHTKGVLELVDAACCHFVGELLAACGRSHQRLSLKTKAL